MVIQVESIESRAGVKFIHPRDRSGDLAIVFSGRAFLENLDYLKALNVAFASRNLGWSEEITRPFIERELNVDALTGGKELPPNNPEYLDLILKDSRKALQIPSTILLRKEGASPGDYFALSSGRMFFVPTREGEKNVFFHILRAIDGRFRGKHRGRTLVEFELLNHGQAEAYVHRSSNPMALYTNTRLENLVREGNHPLTSPFIEGSIAYSVTKEVLKLTSEGQHSLGLDGVIRGLYSEPNTSYTPDQRYRAFNLYERMIKPIEKGGFGMDLLGGDTIMSYYPIK